MDDIIHELKYINQFNPNESWKVWPVYDKYWISDQGRFLSLKTKQSPPTNLLKAYPIKTGYLTVNFTHKGQGYVFNAHALVAQNFIGPRPEGFAVRHLDGNKHNNAVINLSYGTYSENEQDKKLHGTYVSGENYGPSKLINFQAKEIRQKYITGKYTQGQLAQFYKISQGSIARIVKNESYHDATYTYEINLHGNKQKDFSRCGWF